jgi:hypothetical protein
MAINTTASTTTPALSLRWPRHLVQTTTSTPTIAPITAPRVFVASRPPWQFPVYPALLAVCAGPARSRPLVTT